MIIRPQFYRIEEGQFVVVGEDGYDPATITALPEGFWTEDGQQTMDWDYETSTIVELLDHWRNRLWDMTKATRDAAMAGGCDTPVGRVQTDDRSRAVIDGFAMDASLNPSFSRLFTLANNDDVEVDAAAMASIKLAVSDHINAVHIWSQGRRALIWAAPNVSAARAINLSWDEREIELP